MHIILEGLATGDPKRTEASTSGKTGLLSKAIFNASRPFLSKNSSL